jgi:hypothetical protein
LPGGASQDARHHDPSCGASGEIRVFLLLFRETKEDSSFFEKKAAKKLLFLVRLRRFADSR